MKKIGLAALTAVLISGSAYAADLGGSYKDSPSNTDYPTAARTFQGVGVTLFGGGQFTNVNLYDEKYDFEFDGIGADGLVGGLGLDYLVASGRFRFGAYVEGALSNVNTKIEFGPYGGDLLQQNHYYGGGLKGGAVFGNSFLYARAGIERASWEFAEEVDVDVDSFVIGGGAETMIAENIALGIGVDYVTPFNIEADGQDLTDTFEKTESIRAVGRITRRF